ncbi:MAG: HMA2 domain-containing protein [Desulfobaccales bacterium]
MTDSDRRRKKRQTLVEGFNDVPNILEEARRAVDDVTQTPRTRGGKPAGPPASLTGKHGGAAAPTGQKAAPGKKSAKEGGRAKKLPPPPALRVPGAAVPAPAAPAAAPSPTRSLADFGIRVKHALPGRVRLRLRNLLHNEALAAELPPLLAAVPGVASVEASPASGSLLITFSPGELAAAQGRRALAGVMHRFFPGLDMEDLLQRLLGG